MEQKNKKGLSRRKLFVKTFQAVGLSILGGLVWGAYINKASSAPLALRPPGALPEKEFLKKCIRCGLCVEYCPYKTLKLATPEQDIPVGTPYFQPRKVPCYMCTDIPCAVSCPTGALDIKTVSDTVNGKTVLNINKARMGLAVINQESCIAYWGIQCDACYRACPLIDKAITINYMRNERTGKHAYLVPTVHSNYCTGCGLCEYACVTVEPSIYVLPRHVIKGKAGQHYLKGWEKEQKIQMIQEKRSRFTTPRSEKSPLEYLNEGDLLND